MLAESPANAKERAASAQERGCTEGWGVESGGLLQL